MSRSLAGSSSTPTSTPTTQIILSKIFDDKRNLLIALVGKDSKSPTVGEVAGGSLLFKVENGVLCSFAAKFRMTNLDALYAT